MNSTQYWKECVSQAAEECGLSMSESQQEAIAAAAESAHQFYGMAFYSPPASDRLNDIEKEWKAKLDKLQKELDGYRSNAEKAVGKALHQFSDTKISIEDNGEVFRYNGRIERIL